MAWPLIAGGLGVLGEVAGGLISKSGQEETNQAQMELAQKQMDFQRDMSSTAYQRAMADMKAAGLNPMLAFQQGGASTPQGTMATLSNPDAALGGAVQGAVSSALQASQAAKQVELLDAQKEKTVQEAGRAYWDKQGAQQLYGQRPYGPPDASGPSLFQASKGADLAMTLAQASSARNLARISQRDADVGTSTLGRSLNWMRQFRESILGGSNPAAAAGQLMGGKYPVIE